MQGHRAWDKDLPQHLLQRVVVLSFVIVLSFGNEKILRERRKRRVSTNLTDWILDSIMPKHPNQWVLATPEQVILL